jgi:spore coat protein U-like protein
MNNSKRFSLIGFFAGVLLTPSAMAADNAVVNVSATVAPICKFNSGGSVVFTLDPSSGAQADGAITQPEFWCTKGTTYTITDDLGLHESGTIFQMKHASLNEYIPYSFTYTASSTGSGKNSPIAMDVVANVPNAAFVDASEGSYSDVITLTINP